MGIMEGDQQSPTLMQQNMAEPVANTSKYGKTPIEAFGQGGSWFAQFLCLEYIAGASVLAWWPFSGTLGLMGVIARSYRTMAAALVLTAVTGTPAKLANNLNTLTANLTILAPGYNTQFLLGPTHRKLPIRQQLYLYDTTGGGVFGWFTLT